MTYKVEKTDAEWRELLTDEQYHVCRCAETEMAFTGKYCDNKRPGIYKCVACSNTLFLSKSKFDSGTGWPSFSEPVSASTIETREDYSHGMIRTEVLCADCGSHLGHIFVDRRSESGLRYCINSASLEFDASE